MAEFSIRPNNMKSAVASLADCVSQINSMQAEVASVSNSLSMKIAATGQIKAKLKSVGTNMEREKKSVRGMSDALGQIINQYETTEKRIQERANVKQFTMRCSSSCIISKVSTTATIIPAASIIGVSKTASTIWKKFISWYDSIRKSSGAMDGLNNSGSAERKNTSNLTPTTYTNEQIFSELSSRYQRLRDARGKSFDGKCGAYVYQQLKDMGIVTGVAGESTQLGKDYASVLAKKGVTSSGYTCTSYQSLKDVVANAGPMVSNVVVSVDTNYPGTKGVASSAAGHVLLISYIKDGMVYFTESTKWLSGYTNGSPNPEGTVLSMTIDAFEKTYFKNNKCMGITHLHK